jgi:hypothetical protein
MLSLRHIRSLLFALTLCGFVTLALPTPSAAQVAVGVSITIAPPELPVYEQPEIPGPGYIWTPGYWAWDPDEGDYYWVPGTWVEAPEVGFLWTPGYWGWNEGIFVWNAGYWGPEVGFYGGICYGFGYGGVGYEGGYWRNNEFFYNREVNNIGSVHITNVYEKTVVNNVTVNKVSFNGGTGGTAARPTPQEEAAARARHIGPTSAQVQHEHTASTNRELHASQNHGKPPIAATPKPGAFSDRGVVSAKEGGRYNPPARSEGNAGHPNTAVHPNELPSATRPAASNTGNAKVDKKYQQQQEKLSAKQDQERKKLQQQQERDHQRLTQQNADDAKKQQLERQHQQQTQQLVQKHAQQQQKLQEKQQPQQPKPPTPPKDKP